MSITSLLVAAAESVCKWRVRESEVVVFGGLIDGLSQPAPAAGDYSDEAPGEALGESPADARQATRCRARRRRVKETSIVFTNLSQHHTTFAAI
jgi:hypothetical protein